MKGLFEAGWKNSVLAGLLVALGFPPIEIWPLAWIGLFLFYRAVLDDDLVDAQSNRRMARAFFFYNLVVTTGGFYWLAYVLREFGGMPWLAAVPSTLGIFGLCSIWAAILGALWGGFGVSLHSRHRPWALAILFLFWDVVDTRIFPWSIVMGVGANRELLATSGVLGTWGWRLVFFGLMPLVYGWQKSRQLDPRLKFIRIATLVIFVLGGLWGLGAWRIRELQERYPERQPVVLIQGNVGNFQKKLTKLGVQPTINNVLRIHEDLFERIHREAFHSRRPEMGEPEPWYAWPETSFPGFPVNDPGQRAWVRRRLDQTRGLHLIGAYERNPQMEGGRELLLDFNIVALFHESVGYVSHYEKVNLLAWGEYIPYGDRFPKLYEIFSAVNHFGRGLEPKELVHPDPKGPIFVPLICYEILLPGFVTDFVQKVRAKYPGRDVILVNPVNDSWYGPTSEPWQHSLLARWEVARQGVPMIRPTNTGLSQVIAPWGEVLAVGPRDEIAFVLGELPVSRTIKLGDFAPQGF